MGSAGLGLVAAAPVGPVQCVGDGAFAVVDEAQEAADFGEGQRDESSVYGWCCFCFGRFIGELI